MSTPAATSTLTLTTVEVAATTMKPSPGPSKARSPPPYMDLSTIHPSLLEPPRHSRPLYWTIPLPPEDGDDDVLQALSNTEHNAGGTDRHGSQWPSPGYMWPISSLQLDLPVGLGQRQHWEEPAGRPPLTAVAAILHPAVAMHVFNEPNAVTLTPNLGDRRLAWRSEALAPATNPPVGSLKVVLLPTGDYITVHGRRGAHGDREVVMVSDVLDAVGTLRHSGVLRMRSGGMTGNPIGMEMGEPVHGLYVQQTVGGLLMGILGMLA